MQHCKHFARSVLGFTDDYRPIIAEANVNAPTFAKIFKDMIIFTEPSKPLPRAAKGTILRKQALALYSDAIQKLCVADILQSGRGGIDADGGCMIDIKQSKRVRKQEELLLLSRGDSMTFSPGLLTKLLH